MAYHTWKSQARHCRRSVRELRMGHFVSQHFVRLQWKRLRMKWTAVCAFK